MSDITGVDADRCFLTEDKTKHNRAEDGAEERGQTLLKEEGQPG